MLLVLLSAVLTVGVLFSLLGYILIRGIPQLTPSLFSLTYTTENVSMLPAILNTVTMTALSLLLAVPLGVGSAIYLVEYAKRGNRLVELVRLTAETLSGIPPSFTGCSDTCFCHRLQDGQLAAERNPDAHHYDFAAHHAHHGGGAQVGA